jgi:Ca2+-binding RTX toxin-like protein
VGVIYAQGEGITSGTEGADRIYGNELSNELWGNGGNDRLYGGAGNDFLSGSRGRDRLTGGDGYDDFYFGTSALLGNSYDIITDYNKKYDAIVLSKLSFKDIGRANTWMKPSAFWQGTKAHDSNDRIIYNPKNGIVYYDADGTGSKEAIPFVKIGAGRKMSAGDFWVDPF